MVLQTGRITAIIGALITALSLVVGFVMMFTGHANAKLFLVIVPFGFFVLFVGVVTTFLAGEPGKNSNQLPK